MMKVLLVDDHPLFRQGLKALLERNDEIEIVGEASDGAEAVNMARERKPDIVIMDISMPGYCGLDATQQIRESLPGTKVLILSVHDENAYVDQALKAGASGYIHKDAVYDELVIALDAIGKDRPYLSPTVLQPVIRSYINASPATGALALYNSLTAREKEVFTLMIKGRSRNVIAGILHISPKTVDRHRSNLLEKLNMRREAELLEFARLVGLTGS
jgi:two-component system, NarL family, response regulator NreC